VKPRPIQLNGVVPIDKPVDWTSADVVRKMKTFLPRGTKIGHAGTLDPNATGVLPILIGRATKLQDQLMKMEKSYEGTILLGLGTDTDDVRGATIEEDAEFTFAKIPDIESRLAALQEEFSGEYDQLPPQYSALKVEGKRAYDLARQGKQFELKPRQIKVTALSFAPLGEREIAFEVTCGSGFYVRSLARDLGRKLGTCGTLKDLRRTSCGGFDVEQLVRMDELSPEKIEQSMVRISRLIDPIDSRLSLG
jgi:tRNA pseudouridine55 synthase